MRFTISVIRGSSGLGSAINSCMLVNTVEIFKQGFQAPCKDKIENRYAVYLIHVHLYKNIKTNKPRRPIGHIIYSLQQILAKRVNYHYSAVNPLVNKTTKRPMSLNYHQQCCQRAKKMLVCLVGQSLIKRNKQNYL